MTSVKYKSAHQEDVFLVKEIEIESELSPWSIEDYLIETKKADNIFYVAKIEDKIVGFIIARLIIDKDISSEDNEIEIYNIAVLNAFRGKSIAAGLLNKVFEIGVENRVKKIHLEVRKSNLRARRFYTKHHFEIHGERRNFYTNPQEDAVLMCRRLSLI